MNRSKKESAIVGLPQEEKLTIQKSFPLLSLVQTDMTLAEFKILDIYLSRINSHEPDKRVVIFEKSEIEKLIGVDRIREEVLKERLKHLLGTVVQITDKDCEKGFALCTLFEEAVAEKTESGEWKVILECTQKAMKYIFNIEKIGYLKYKLHNIIQMSSRYSYTMYLYIERNRRRHIWTETVERLRYILNCDKDNYCQTFKYFNSMVLKKCHDEICEKTDIRYTYETIKRGRSVVAIQFTFESNPQNVLPEDFSSSYVLPESLFSEIVEDDDTEQNIHIEGRDAICMGFEWSDFDEFTDEQLIALKDISRDKIPQGLVDKHNQSCDDIVLAREWATAEYLRSAIIVAKARGAKNLYNYIEKMIRNSPS